MGILKSKDTHKKHEGKAITICRIVDYCETLHQFSYWAQKVKLYVVNIAVVKIVSTLATGAAAFLLKYKTYNGIIHFNALLVNIPGACKKKFYF